MSRDRLNSPGTGTVFRRFRRVSVTLPEELNDRKPKLLHGNVVSRHRRRSGRLATPFESVENLLGDEETQSDPVVVTGNAVYAVVDSAPVANAVRDLFTGGVEIVACSNALDNREIDPEELVADVDVAESGVGELTRRQAAGGAYVKVP